MKKLFVIFITMLLFTQINAQSVLSGQVKGRVFDGANGTAIENATVAVYSQPDSSITTGAVTDLNGEFAIDDLPGGVYTLTATFVGYSSKSFSFSLSEDIPVFDVGDIILVEAAEDLGSVSVTAIRPQIVYRDNKKILKVKEFQDAGASTLAEVLENAPSITLDAEGNVLLRGSGNYTLLIDGKPVPGVGVNMLRQIPPEMVEDVEIMTNPSAKYDPDGVTGIINLVLKKQTEAGLNGQVSLMAGLRDKYNGDAQFNYRKNKVNIFAGVTGTSYYTTVTGNIFRETSAVGNESEIDNGFGQSAKINTIVGNLGMDYTINDRNSISLSGRFGPQNISALVDNEIVRTVTDPTLTGNFNFSNDLHVDGIFYMPNLTWDHKFKKEGSKLQTSMFVGGFQGNLVQELSEEAMDASWQPTGVFTDRRRLDNAMDINDIRVKTDYENSIEGKGKLELGYQYRRLLENNDQVHEDYILPGGTWLEDPSLSNEFQLDRSIHALYFTWGGDLGKFNYQLGLRNEYTDRILDQVDSSTEYSYSKFNMFPSGNITRKFKDNQQLQLSYSRRINRPGRQQLNPVKQYADNQLVVSGSPDIRPEFIDSYELAYQNQIKMGFVSVEAYYRMVDDLMTNVLTPEADGVMHQHFVNANRSHSAGTELMANIQPAQWLRVITSGNFYYYALEDDSFYEGNDNNSFVWRANFTSVFLPTKSTRLTFSAIYNGPSITLQGTQKESYMFNVGVRQEMLKKKASLALSVRDLFKTFRIENEIKGEDYLTVTSIQPESQVVTLTFTYNFNNYRQRAQEENMDLNFIR